jgi:hypothetical protein
MIGIENDDSAAQLLLSFIDQVRREATHYMCADPCAKDPLQLAYQFRLSNLSDADLQDLVRILRKMVRDSAETAEPTDA